MTDQPEFLYVEPLLRFNPPHTAPWARVAIHEAKAPGTFVHIGDQFDRGETILTYAAALQLHRWLGQALGLSK